MTKFQKMIQRFCKNYNHCSKCEFDDKGIYDEAHLVDIPYTNIEWHNATQAVKHQESKSVYPMKLIDADALYNGTMKDEYFNYVEHDNHGKESFAYSCAMQRLVEALAIDAIPVEWLREKMNMADDAGDLDCADIISWILQEWQNEQEEHNG